ncbi:histidine kinase [Spirosoma sp. KCTC 42546]|uniref:sensor histidine kinase n=1 Tax=Spirosoma sp. KCTC 42546 TaxID=2520506 RepID=UPI00115894E5|nr:histidine kinase [Spirosoma sp. KCTC 42546]QDK80076.1 histidine kinase [Spirosoma sp. KCTC 42546]
MEKLNDRWLRLVGVPLISIVSNFIFFQPDNDARHISRWVALGISLAECVLIWEVARLGIIQARRRYPRLNQTTARVCRQLAWFVIITVVQRVALVYLYDVTQFWGYPMSTRSYWVNTLIPFLFVVPLAVIYEAHYLYRQWWATYYEAEQLKKEALQSQLDSLKAQINPHFLFNSLSTLSSLVTENPKQAETFIEELASVYRYVLQTNEQLLTSLASELTFIQAYFHLLQMRFGRSVELDVTVDESYLAFFIPPLTLQLLVENAVKHNTALPAKPLVIRIYTDADKHLVVSNTRRPKQNRVPSNRTGLAHITAKYRLLGQPDVVINQSDDCFQVLVPLIQETRYDYSHH